MGRKHLSIPFQSRPSRGSEVRLTGLLNVGTMLLTKMFSKVQCSSYNLGQEIIKYSKSIINRNNNGRMTWLCYIHILRLGKICQTFGASRSRR